MASDDTHRPRHARPAVPTTAAPPEQALRQMVGVSVEASLDELRTAYDLAMHRATRAGDHQHALTLSRAYDRLPVTTRDRLYPSSRTVAGGSAPRQPPARGWMAFGATPRPRNSRRRRARGVWLRLLVYGLVAPLAVGIGTYVGAHRYEQQQTSTPQLGTPVVRAGYPTAPTMSAGAAPVIVPTSAPTGANGLVTLLCRPASSAGGYAMTAPRGAVVVCTNGATPTVVG